MEGSSQIQLDTQTSPDIELDFSACEREVLDRTGRLQAQGSLLLLHADSLKPEACSENWNSQTPYPVKNFEQAYDLQALIGADLQLETWTDQPQSIQLANRPGIELIVSRQQDLLQLEWLPLTNETAARALPEPSQLADCNTYEASQRVADQIRQELGLDRVMIYQFDVHHAGDVIAEARRSDWEPYLGLHYPATDIPQIARDLYLKIRLRSIHDAYAGPVPLLTRKGLRADSVDLTSCSLRSVSPYHLEYLRNMGVRATVSVAIIVEGKLWGLIACHHGSPLVLSLAARRFLLKSAEQLADCITASEASQLTHNQQALTETFKELRHLLIEQYALSDAQLIEHLLLGPYSLGALTRSQGAALYADGTLVGTGPHPSLEWVRDFVENYLSQTESGAFTSDRLSQESPVALPAGSDWSGMLAIMINREPQVVAMVFRQPYLKEIHWGGDPDRPALADDKGRLSPRRSFHLWKETVMDQSKPWQSLDIEFLKGLQKLLNESFASGELCGRIQRGSRGLTAQMVEHAYIARAITSGSQHGLVMTTVETGASPATLLQLNQNLQELFELTPDRWRKGETVGYFLSRLGLVKEDQSIGHASDRLPDRLAIWSPVLGHRNLKIARQILIRIEKNQERHAVVSLQFHDVTGEERLSDALRSAIERAEVANEAKTRFLANTSHELKTPLHAILGFQGLLDLELSDTAPNPAELKLCSDQIGQASRHMLNLVEQLLFFSKSSRTGLRLPVTDLDLATLVAETISWQQYGAGLKNINIQAQLPAEGLAASLNDQTIRQLLTNLLSNAIKFTPAGGQILCRLYHDKLAALAQLQVSDTGLGMTAEEQTRAFEPFYQGKSDNEGAGIGLSLVKAIAEAHGGRVELSSQIDVGTQITVFLPLMQPEAEIELKVVKERI